MSVCLPQWQRTYYTTHRDPILSLDRKYTISVALLCFQLRSPMGSEYSIRMLMLCCCYC
jgi:hypothetical protein